MKKEFIKIKESFFKNLKYKIKINPKMIKKYAPNFVLTKTYNPMNKNTIIKLLKSGNFTIAYHDSGECTLYKGHKAYEDLPEDGIADFGGQTDGYIEDVVELLVEALGGKTETI